MLDLKWTENPTPRTFFKFFFVDELLCKAHFGHRTQRRAHSATWRMGGGENGHKERQGMTKNRKSRKKRAMVRPRTWGGSRDEIERSKRKIQVSLEAGLVSGGVRFFFLCCLWHAFVKQTLPPLPVETITFSSFLLLFFLPNSFLLTLLDWTR